MTQLLEAAAAISNRVVSDALWDGDRCTWMGYDLSFDGLGQSVTTPARADGTVYRGSSGMALFLMELFVETREPAVRRAAEGALRHAMAMFEGRDPKNGLYDGLPGVCCALARYADITGSDEFATAAEQVVSRIRQGARTAWHTDLIGGLAGNVVGLLNVWRSIGSASARNAALESGDRLLRLARRWPSGWSWGFAQPLHRRHLTGLAHGASGCALAFLELHDVTTEPRFRHAAEQALIYERQFFDPSRNYWKDLRDPAGQELLFAYLRKEVSDTYEGAPAYLPDGTQEQRVADEAVASWCYGTTGIGLVRTRAYEILGDSIYREEAASSVQTTLRETPRTLSYCLCHGVSGNDTLLVRAARVLGEPKLLETALQRALAGIEKFENRRKEWPSGFPSGIRGLTLMQGDAGIGSYLLALRRLEVPFAALPTCQSANTRDFSTYEADGLALRRDHVSSFLPTTLSTMRRVGVDMAVVDAAIATSAPGSEVWAARRALDQACASSPRLLELLADASRVEDEVLRLHGELIDFSDCFRRELRQLPSSVLETSSCTVRLRDSVRLVEQQRDWNSWLAHDDSAEAVESLPAERSVFTMLFQNRDAVVVRQLSAFSATVFRAMTTPTTIAEITADIVRRGRVHHAPEKVHTAVAEQVVKAFEAGLVEVVSADAAAVSVE